MRRLRLLLAAAAVAACRPTAPASPGPVGPPGGPVAIVEREDPAPSLPRTSELASFPSEWRLKAGGRAPFAEREMVASNAPLASQAGLEVLAAGGNAVDAAVATGFALAVVYPEAGNLGGGGYAVIRMADGRTAALDYREKAPAAATRDMFIDPATGRPGDKSLVGHLASGVPGAVAGLLAQHERFGALPRAAVLAPAIRLAREGFLADSAFVRSVARDSALICRFAGCATFFPGGRALAAGTVFRQPELARTLERIAAGGHRGFYDGEIPRAIEAEMRRGGGVITAADLAAYRPAWRTPLTGAYRGHGILAMPPSSSGGVTVIEALNLLEAAGPPAPAGSAAALHRLLGAFQLAFIDRNEYIADPDVVAVPVDRLTDKAYAAAQWKRLDPTRYVPTRTLAPGLGPRREGDETTHYSVVDRFGNAVATTTTVNGLHGSGVWVPGAGFFLNNEMDDFAAQPGQPNMFGLVQGEANAVGPGKRMLSAMSPTIVLDRQGQVLLVVGSRGGPRIITGVAQVILNVVDHGMSLADAMAAPRVHFQGLPETVSYERGGFAADVLTALTRMGWQLAPGGSGSPVAILRVRGGWEGMWDPRAAGGVAGR
jgi:gamma-glutamyltranspeptidase/glutathione hydrolase